MKKGLCAVRRALFFGFYESECAAAKRPNKTDPAGGKRFHAVPHHPFPVMSYELMNFKYEYREAGCSRNPMDVNLPVPAV